MRSIRGRRMLYCTAALVAIGFSSQRAQAQEEAPLAASPTPPPDVQQREKMVKAAPAPAQSPEVEELLKKLQLSRADIEQRKADKAQRELPASTDEPPDVKEHRKAQRTPEAPGQSPDLNELIDKIGKQPGGAEKLEKARKSGARIPEKRADRSGRLEFSLAGWPGRGEGAQGNLLRATRPAPSQNVPGLGTLDVWDLLPWSTSVGTLWGIYQRWTDPYFWSGSQDVKPQITASVNLVTPGWYLINFVASRGRANLRRWDSASRSYPTLVSWDNSTSTRSFESYPALVFLAPGQHYFYWIPDASTFYFVSEVTVMRL